MTQKRTTSFANGRSGYAEGHSVSQWIARLKREPDGRAAQKIWDRYSARLIRIACKKLGAAKRGIADEDDIVAEAFAHFFVSAKRGKFSRLDDRNDLWQILVMLTERRAVDHWRREGRDAKPQRLPGASLAASRGSRRQSTSAQIPDNRPNPMMAAMMVEEFQLRLQALDDATLQSIAVQKMQGKSNQEIASQLDLGLRSVERKFSLIRKIWRRKTTDERS